MWFDGNHQTNLALYIPELVRLLYLERTFDLFWKVIGVGSSMNQMIAGIFAVAEALLNQGLGQYYLDRMNYHSSLSYTETTSS